MPLEPEERRTFLASRNRKTLNNSASKEDDSFFIRAMAKKGFTQKVFIVAAVAMASLHIIASSGDTTKEMDLSQKMKTKPPIIDPEPSPVQATTTPETTPVETPSESEPTPAAPIEPEPEASPSITGKELFEDGEYVYSKISKPNALYDHKLPDEDKKKELAEKYGKWNFWDGDEEDRPANDYMAKYPNRDIPGDDLPEDAWQADAVFVNHYLNDADKLITRAMEAIYSEYGHEKPTDPDAMIERMKLLHWTKIDIANENPPVKYHRRGDRGDGGWTTKRSYGGLVRRLLHAMMTSDTFTVVLAGHSAAAGHGNHFRQSYLMHFHKVMEPIFARLGVKLESRNMGMGGMGTIHNAVGSGSIYGNEVDLLLWDSGMTESRAVSDIDIFLRQGLIGGNRVPVLWGGNFDLLKMLHEEADADIGEFGCGTDVAIEAKDKEHFDSLPYPSKGVTCKEDIKPLCDEEPRFCASCWIDREDGIKPEKKQLDNPKGQVKWHPGWRSHQITGRNIAMGLLTALQSAVNLWTENVMGGPPLVDEYWHVTDYYNNIREKVKNLDKNLGECYKNIALPDRVCNTPMKARTQFTPRANFHETSLTTIIKPTADGYVPKNNKVALYEGPDAHNTCFHLPEGAIDVFDVVSTRRRLSSGPSSTVEDRNEIKSFNIHLNGAYNRSLEGSDIIPGKGWEVWGEPQGVCDGTYDAVCGRSTDNECVLYGHHDFMGDIIGNEFSGWLVLTLQNVTEGLIVIKLQTWHDENENENTADWTTVNNEGGRRRLRQGSRVLRMRNSDTVDLPDTFEFDWAIDGKVTTWNKKEFLEHDKRTDSGRVEFFTLLDDENFTSESKDIEVAIRMRGCKRVCTFGVSHVYWA